MDKNSFEEELKKSVEKIFEAGYQIDGEAFNFLRSILDLVNPETIVKTILEMLNKGSHRKIFVDKELVEEALTKIQNVQKVEDSTTWKPEIMMVEYGKGVFHPYAKEVESKIEVLRDPTNRIASGGSLEDFSSYFKDRFKRLVKILSQRLDVKGYISVKDALKERSGAKIKVVGMVSEKVFRGKKIFFTIEDFEAAASVIVQQTKPELIKKAQEIFLDQVVCVVGFKGANDLIIAEDLIFPDVPYHKPNRSKEPLNLILTSDFHVGSKVFEEKLVNRFIDWLKGKIGKEKDREIAGKVKYIIIAGDLVDGVGLYPQQEDELEIKDIYKQYKFAAKIFEQIPDYIEVLIIPGNHDATRKTLPQPAIQKRFAEPIYQIPNLTLLGNPSQVKVHGVNILIHHGRSLEDVLTSLPNVNHQNIVEAMAQLLKVRHLSPIYGQKTPIAPEPRDWMVVENIPDIYHTGHLHVFGYTNYKGIWLVNSGCWQKQTSYQKKMGITPVFGVIPVINLQTLTQTTIDFKNMSL